MCQTEPLSSVNEMEESSENQVLRNQQSFKKIQTFNENSKEHLLTFNELDMQEERIQKRGDNKSSIQNIKSAKNQSFNEFNDEEINDN